MARWYRAYEGTVTDAKLGEVALVAGCSRSVAIAAWHAILESAAAVNDGGRFNVTARRIAVILCEPVATIEAVMAEMTQIGMVSSDCVAAWARRQFESDSSTERSRKHRERRRNDDATLHGRCATPPYTETDTEIDASASIARAPAAESQKTKLKRRITDAYFRLANDPGRPSIDTGQIDVWEAQGYDLGLVEAVVMERLEARLRSGKPVRSLSYFADSVKEAHEKRAPPAPPKAEEPDWRAMMARFKGKGMWPSSAGPQPGYAGCRAPPDLLREFGYGAAA